MNRRIDINDFTIYAMLTDTKRFEFFAYNGEKREFYRDKNIHLSGETLGNNWEYITSMVEG